MTKGKPSTISLKEKQLLVFQNMYAKTVNLKDKFIPYVQILVEENENMRVMFEENDVYSILKCLLFGVDDKTYIKKVDLVKNKNLIKLIFLNLPDFYKSLCFIQALFIQIDEYIWYINKTYYDEVYKIDNEYPILNNIETTRFMNVLEIYKEETTYIRSSISTLKELIRNSCMLNSMSELDFEERHNKIVNLKKETTKKYYFYDLYEIKDGIKRFQTNDMFFGEMNAIMHSYNKIVDFIFKDFCFFYNSIKSNIEEIIKQATK